MLLRKVIISGTACHTEHLAFQDNFAGIEKWGLARSKYYRNYDLVFDLHPFDVNRKQVPEDYEKRLLELEHKLMTIYPVAEYPFSTIFPIRKVSKCIGRNYFLSSLAYMVAYAIYCEYTTIYIQGMDFMIWDVVEAKQIANIEYLIGLAEGRGIEVIVDPVCDLLENPYMYGYHWNTQVATMPHIQKTTLLVD